MGMGDKLIAAGIAVAFLAGMGWLFNHQISARVKAEERATAAEIAQELSERQLERITQDLEDEKRRSAQLDDDLQQARIVEAEAIEVLEDRGRLARLTQAKPGLLEIKARKATTRVWETIEAEANAPP